MLYFHSFWTRPYFATSQAQQVDHIELWEFEALTWLLSALRVRQHSPIRLVTDSRGLRFVRTTGLDWIYNGGITTALDDVPEDIDPHLFWSAGKVFSWLLISEPAMSLDTDAVLWHPIDIASPVMALHHESETWPWYASNQKDFGRFGFSGPEWDWELRPLNLGVLYGGIPSFMRYYAETSINFMKSYSAVYGHHTAEYPSSPSHHKHATLFAEQRLLVMCAHRAGFEVEPITQLDPESGLLKRDRRCMHLWALKEYYRYSAEARVALCNSLISTLLTGFPESRRTLAQWNLDSPMVLDRKMQLNIDELAPDDDRRTRIHLITELDGVLWIADPNLEARRRACIGSLVLPGDTLEPAPGTTWSTRSAGDT